ncbi:arginine--tRNA ligase, partial [Candidatus Gottesmanbacteria bacterium]|nr:arginine--tRNA ligase [Candidatus Gottesmanbacteria bacterium]
FINQVGLPTYEAKDMALAKLQFSEFKPDLIIHVVGPEQKGYFEVLFKALAQLFPETAGKEYHIIYGWVRLKTGKMSSRSGEVVLAEWLLDEVKKRLKNSFKMSEEVGEKVAVGAVKYSILKFSPTSEIAFDIDESINLEGDSGPYLQYTYARCKSVLRRAEAENGEPLRSAGQFSAESNRSLKEEKILAKKLAKDSSKIVGLPAALNPEELAILRALYRFPEVVSEAARAYSPNLICTFLFDLCQKYNLFYNRLPILKAESPELVKTRLALTAATAQIIKNGLYLLGIKVVKKM